MATKTKTKSTKKPVAKKPTAKKKAPIKRQAKTVTTVSAEVIKELDDLATTSSTTTSTTIQYPVQANEPIVDDTYNKGIPTWVLIAIVVAIAAIVAIALL